LLDFPGSGIGGRSRRCRVDVCVDLCRKTSADLLRKIPPGGFVDVALRDAMNAKGEHRGRLHCEARNDEPRRSWREYVLSATRVCLEAAADGRHEVPPSTCPRVLEVLENSWEVSTDHQGSICRKHCGGFAWGLSDERDREFVWRFLGGLFRVFVDVFQDVPRTTGMRSLQWKTALEQCLRLPSVWVWCLCGDCREVPAEIPWGSAWRSVEVLRRSHWKSLRGSAGDFSLFS
jgi:hypothetical protein